MNRHHYNHGLAARIEALLIQGQMTAFEIADEMDVTHKPVRMALWHLVDAGKAVKIGQQPNPSGVPGKRQYLYGLAGVTYTVAPVRPRHHGIPAGHSYYRQYAGWGQWR